jgi:hypothetical protein
MVALMVAAGVPVHHGNWLCGPRFPTSEAMARLFRSMYAAL